MSCILPSRSPLFFEGGQVVFEDFLRAFKHQQDFLCRFSVATAFLRLFEVPSLPDDYWATPLDMTSG